MQNPDDMANRYKLLAERSDELRQRLVELCDSHDYDNADEGTRALFDNIETSLSRITRMKYDYLTALEINSNEPQLPLGEPDNPSPLERLNEISDALDVVESEIHSVSPERPGLK